jgi:DNA polymerase-3 subunit beta
MEFKIDKNILSNALTLLNPYLEKKDSSSVCANVLIKSNGLSLTMYASNYDFGLKLDVIALDITDGEYLVNGTSFLNIVKRLKSAEVHVINENGIVTIKQGRSKLRLDSLPTVDYPSIVDRKEDMKFLDVNSDVLVNGIKKTQFAIDTNNPKFELNCLLIQLEDVVNFVSTDTRRLALYNTGVKTLNNDELLISKESITEMQKLLNSESKIYYNDNMLIMENSNSMYFTKLVNGKFPDFKRVIPIEFKHTFSIPKADFVDAIKLVSSQWHEIRITFSTNLIHIESAQKGAKYNSETDIEYEFYCNGTISILCDANFLAGAISNIEKDLVKLCINESKTPFCIIDDNYKVINMPIVENLEG